MQKKYIQNEKADILTFGNNDKKSLKPLSAYFKQVGLKFA